MLSNLYRLHPDYMEANVVGINTLEYILELMTNKIRLHALRGVKSIWFELVSAQHIAVACVEQ